MQVFIVITVGFDMIPQIDSVYNNRPAATSRAMEASSEDGVFNVSVEEMEVKSV